MTGFYFALGVGLGLLLGLLFMYLFILWKMKI